MHRTDRLSEHDSLLFHMAPMYYELEQISSRAMAGEASSSPPSSQSPPSSPSSASSQSSSPSGARKSPFDQLIGLLNSRKEEDAAFRNKTLSAIASLQRPLARFDSTAAFFDHVNLSAEERAAIMSSSIITIAGNDIDSLALFKRADLEALNIQPIKINKWISITSPQLQ